jgi:N-methylhydantoinase A/oxoprolinase/acetone carboxylase beta subunit
MGPLFVADICKDLGITEIVVPAASATFSAHGLLVSEHERNYVRTFRWTERDPEHLLVGVFESMERQAIEEFAAVGIHEKQLSFHWEADIRFEGQFFEFSIPVPRGTLDRSAVQSVRKAFVAMYEERYGSETAWRGQMEIVNCRLRAREIRPAVQSSRFPDAPSKPSECLKGSRRAFVSPDGMADLPIYDGTRCGPGTALEGPAIIEEEMTTILVPPHFSVKRDSLMNYLLTSRGA